MRVSHQDIISKGNREVVRIFFFLLSIQVKSIFMPIFTSLFVKHTAQIYKVNPSEE